MSFTQQQLEAAYKQMEAERQADNTFAQQAADKLSKLLAHPQVLRAAEKASIFSHGGITPLTAEYKLVISLSQHDDWHQCYNDLVAAGVTMKPWNSKFHPGPEGEFDVSSDAQFAGRPTQKYSVHIEYYDGGY